MNNRGWKLLQEGNYLDACAAFDQLEPDARALGYARCATRLGQFRTALLWIREGFSLCYTQAKQWRLLQYHGALGELLVRGLQPEKALLHMQIANRLRPAGHPERQRQYSYLAIPLARLGQYSLAESHYMRAYVLAKQQKDNLGMSHALARRAMLSVHSKDSIYWQNSKALFPQIVTPCSNAMAIVNLISLMFEGRLITSEFGIPYSIEWQLLQQHQSQPMLSLPTIDLPADNPRANKWLSDINITDLQLQEQRLGQNLQHLFA